MRIAVIGVTGLVGSLILRMLDEREFPIKELLIVSSSKSVGKEFFFKNKKHIIMDIEQAFYLFPNIAFFSAEEEISKKWAPLFAIIGTIVIDNSSAWRMNNSIKLIVPEINAHILSRKDRIISNPNCSTIQLVIILNNIYKKYKINSIVISTYQSITGSGKKSVDQFIYESQGLSTEKIYPHPIFQNLLPQCDNIEYKGYTKEEIKLIKEPLKIMDVINMKITATSVRIPVTGGHSECVNITFKNFFDIKEIKTIMKNSSSIIIKDDLGNNDYPLPIIAHGKDEVFVGRLRKDLSNDKTLNVWIVADNLRKGAATNAVQIAEYLIEYFKL